MVFPFFLLRGQQRQHCYTTISNSARHKNFSINFIIATFKHNRYFNLIKFLNAWNCRYLVLFWESLFFKWEIMVLKKFKEMSDILILLSSLSLYLSLSLVKTYAISETSSASIVTESTKLIKFYVLGAIRFI
jgi:hypothetical protein